MESVLKDMQNREFNDMVQEQFNMDLYKNKKEDLPDTQEELDEYRGYYGSYNTSSNYRDKSDDNNVIRVLYFEYKTYMNQVFKIKNTHDVPRLNLNPYLTIFYFHDLYNVMY